MTASAFHVCQRVTVERAGRHTRSRIGGMTGTLLRSVLVLGTHRWRFHGDNGRYMDLYETEFEGFDLSAVSPVAEREAAKWRADTWRYVHVLDVERNAD